MTRLKLPLLCSALLALGFTGLGQSHAEDMETIAPYKMLRSLQFVQDSVVLGDHSAAEMQRFMLATIDKRLRQADASVFDNTDNVDAALVYAMSGGNPATLEYLVARDVNGNFDSRVSEALRKYLGGKGVLIAKSLADMVPEYKDTKIAPYLALVAGNVTIVNDPVGALKFYDWARLTAPGTIVEEAALRRSLAVAVEAGMVERAAGYANRYARRFLHSPYASQFADIFVQLVVEHYDALNAQDVYATLGYMDSDRQREVYLRIARSAAIKGKNDLARLAAERAKMLSGSAEGADALAALYGGLADIPTSDVVSAIEAISDIPDAMLSPSDRALRSAAEAIAQEVLRKPEPASSAQVESPNVEWPNDLAAIPDNPADVTADPVGTAPATTTAEVKSETPNTDPEFRTFVDAGRSKLDEIDSLLEKESAVK